MSIRHKFFKPEVEVISPVTEWNDLTDIGQLDEIVSASDNIPIVIFKHSTRCDMSSAMLRNFEAKYDIEAEKLTPYYLDLIAHRDISNEIAMHFGVEHQSPQIILIKGDEVIGYASHKDIYFFDLKGILSTHLN